MPTIPSHDIIFRSIAKMESRALFAEHFGRDWFMKGDPRPALQVSWEGFEDWVDRNGIPSAVLVENTWQGDEHFVINHVGNEWRVGYAERGNATLISTHMSLPEARKAVQRELWKQHESAGNPSYWKNGVAAGTQWPES